MTSAPPASAAGPGTGAGKGAGMGGGAVGGISGGVASTVSADAAAGSAGISLYKRAQELEQLTRTDKDREKNAPQIKAIKDQLSDAKFVTGFGSIGGEEFVSYLNISDSLTRRFQNALKHLVTMKTIAATALPATASAAK